MRKPFVLRVACHLRSDSLDQSPIKTMKRPTFDEIREKLDRASQSLRESVRGAFGRLSSRHPGHPNGLEDDAGAPDPLIAPSPVSWQDRIRALLPQLVTFAASAGDRAGALVQKQGIGIYGTALTLLLCSFFLADLTAILFDGFIPEPRGPRGGVALRQEAPRLLSHYNRIAGRNLFNSRGLIPGEDAPTNPTPVPADGPAVKTSLPLTLVGTIITRDPKHSVATIQDKSGQDVFPVRVDDEIPSRIRVTEIESRKVTFVNLQSGRREYVDLPEDAPLKGRQMPARSNTPTGGIVKKAPTQFNIPRTEIDTAMQDLNKILTQARAVPHYENGMPAGFKLFQIVPGSLYDKLGLQNGDVLANVNGEPIDASKAFEMLNELKSTNHVEISIKRNGRDETLVYDIN